MHNVENGELQPTQKMEEERRRFLFMRISQLLHLHFSSIFCGGTDKKKNGVENKPEQSISAPGTPPEVPTGSREVKDEIGPPGELFFLILLIPSLMSLLVSDQFLRNFLRIFCPAEMVLDARLSGESSDTRSTSDKPSAPFWKEPRNENKKLVNVVNNFTVTNSLNNNLLIFQSTSIQNTKNSMFTND